MKPILPKGAAPHQLTAPSIVGPMGMTLILTGPQASILQTSGSGLTSGTNGIQGFGGVTSLPMIRPAPLPAVSNIRLAQVPEEKPTKKVEKIKKGSKKAKDKSDESLSKFKLEKKGLQTKTSVKPILPKQETPSTAYLILRCAPASCIVEGPSTVLDASQTEKNSDKKHVESKKNLKTVSKPRTIKKMCCKKIEKLPETTKPISNLSGSTCLQNNNLSNNVNQNSEHQQTSYLLQQNIPSHPPPPYPQKNLSSGSHQQLRNISSKRMISPLNVNSFDSTNLPSNLNSSTEESNSVSAARSTVQGHTNLQFQHAPFRCVGSSDSEKQQSYANESETLWHRHLAAKSFPSCNTQGQPEGTSGVPYEASGISFSNYGYSPTISESQTWASPVPVHNNDNTSTPVSSSTGLKKTSSCGGMHGLISLNGTSNTECNQAHSEDSNSCQYSASVEIDLESSGHMSHSSSTFSQPTVRCSQPPPYFSPSLPHQNEASPVPPQTEEYPMLSASLSGSNSASQLMPHTPTPPSFHSPPVTAVCTDGYHPHSYVSNSSSVHEIPSHNYTNITESQMQRPWSPPPYEMHVRHSDSQHPQNTRKVMSNMTYSVTQAESSEFSASTGSGVPAYSETAGPETSSCVAGSVASPYFQTQGSESTVFSIATVPFTYNSPASLEGITNFPHMSDPENLQNSESGSSSYCPSNMTSGHHGQPPEYPLHVNQHTLTRTKTFNFDGHESMRDVSPPAYPSVQRPSPQPPPPPPQPPPPVHPPPPPPPPKYVCHPSHNLSLILPPHSPPRYHARCSPEPVSTAVPLDAHQNLSDTLIDPDSLVLGNSSSTLNISSAPVLSSPPGSPTSVVPHSQELSTYNSNYSWNQCNSNVQLPIDSYPEVALQAFPSRTQSQYRPGEDVTSLHGSLRLENSDSASGHHESLLYRKQKDRYNAPSFYSSSQHNTHTSVQVPMKDVDISLSKSSSRSVTVMMAAPEKEQIELSNGEKSRKELIQPVIGCVDKVSFIAQSEQDRSYEERRQLARKILNFPEMPKEKDAILKENFCIDEDEPLSIDMDKCQEKDVSRTNEASVMSGEVGQNARGTTRQSRNESKKKKELLCQICGKLLKGSRSLTCHLNSHSGIRPYRCPYCPNAFTNASVLKNHVRTHTGERPYVCTTCKKSFRTHLSLRRHETQHSSARPFHCTLCTKTFKRKVVLQQHIKGFHQRSEGNHKCGVCQKLFSSQKALSLHSHTHERPPPRFACSKCPKVYHFRSLLARHLQNHPKVLKHQCLICDASFAWHGRLLTHLRTHTAPHLQCSSCGATFISSKKLEIHQRRHSNPRPHKCPQCGKRFQHADRLAAHRSLHVHGRNTRKNQSKTGEEVKTCTSYSVEVSSSEVV